LSVALQTRSLPFPVLTWRCLPKTNADGIFVP
jgi:hypothetical protein